MKLVTTAFNDGARIPWKYGFCKLNDDKTVGMSSNINPDFSWSDIPLDAKSLVLICVDTEVPSVGDKVNKEGVTVPKDLPRVDFYHWLLINLPVDSKGIEEGEFSKEVTARGKNDKHASQGTKQGINDYTSWFEGDEDMAGDYFGYDGPCPPWNDERIHRYHFKLFALDVEELDIEDGFRGADLIKKMDGHILGEAEVIGEYTLNKELA
ncbi:MAG: YbhB/YbcL family Raf kinase inhibitor-like protein [Candidatus Heimdallarchaeota archaeon]|nr:YbhB/YbcL family Raf kinase inhibitor-like protein [Candidatus Heimdallarchaeota archaeon]